MDRASEWNQNQLLLMKKYKIVYLICLFVLSGFVLAGCQQQEESEISRVVPDTPSIKGPSAAPAVQGPSSPPPMPSDVSVAPEAVTEVEPMRFELPTGVSPSAGPPAEE
jgi:hypothetical protein